MCSHLTIAANKDDSDVLLFDDDQLCAISECTTIKTLLELNYAIAGDGMISHF